MTNSGIGLNPFAENIQYGLATSPFMQEKLPDPISHRAEGLLGVLENPYAQQMSRMAAFHTAGGFAMHRLQNTIVRGGIGDDLGRTGRIFHRMFGDESKFGRFSRGNLLPDEMGTNRFIGGSNIFGRPTRRGRRLAGMPPPPPRVPPAAGTTPRRVPRMPSPDSTPISVKGFFKNNRLFNPRRFSRLQNLSALGAGPGSPYYAPVGGGALASIGNMLIGTRGFVGGSKEAPLFGGGMFARLGALRKIEKMSARKVSTAAADMNIARIMAMNNPLALMTEDAVHGFNLAARGAGHADGTLAFRQAVRKSATESLRDISSAPLNSLRKIFNWRRGSRCLNDGSKKICNGSRTKG